MGQMIFFGIIGALFLFAAYMFIVTASMGTRRLKTSQYYMSSLKYSKEASTKTNLLIDKYEAQILDAVATDKEIIFTEDGQEVGSIWTNNKYYSYGNLQRYGASKSKEFQCTKPDVKTFHRIIKLEDELKAKAELNTPLTTATKKKTSESEEVLLG